MSRSVEKEPFPPRWAFFVAALMIIAGIGWNIYMQYSATADKNTAQANAATLARDIGTVCAEQGKLMINDRDVCEKGESVLANPTEALPGAKGDKGNTGERGERGERGFPGLPGLKGDKGDKGNGGLNAQGIPGLNGSPGRDGAPGAKGESGADGAPGIPGADGAPGVDGAPGAPGKDGTDGRGLADAQCGADGRWAMYWTDGTTTDGGECRTAPPIGALP